MVSRTKTCNSWDCWKCMEDEDCPQQRTEWWRCQMDKELSNRIKKANSICYQICKTGGEKKVFYFQYILAIFEIFRNYDDEKFITEFSMDYTFWHLLSPSSLILPRGVYSIYIFFLAYQHFFFKMKWMGKFLLINKPYSSLLPWWASVRQYIREGRAVRIISFLGTWLS